MRIAHQAIQVKTMPKLRLPTGVPMNPLKSASRNPVSMSATRMNCGQRDFRADLRSGERVSSMRVISVQ